MQPRLCLHPFVFSHQHLTTVRPTLCEAHVEPTGTVGASRLPDELIKGGVFPNKIEILQSRLHARHEDVDSLPS